MCLNVCLCGGYAARLCPSYYIRIVQPLRWIQRERKRIANFPRVSEEKLSDEFNLIRLDSRHEKRDREQEHMNVKEEKKAGNSVDETADIDVDATWDIIVLYRTKYTIAYIPVYGSLIL